jgi:hypothetical protein
MFCATCRVTAAIRRVPVAVHRFRGTPRSRRQSHVCSRFTTSCPLRADYRPQEVTRVFTLAPFVRRPSGDACRRHCRHRAVERVSVLRGRLDPAVSGYTTCDRCGRRADHEGTSALRVSVAARLPQHRVWRAGATHHSSGLDRHRSLRHLGNISRRSHARTVPAAGAEPAAGPFQAAGPSGKARIARLRPGSRTWRTEGHSNSG